ncbi:hypothetical protein ACFXGT_08025 [Streptomyces sp. NPDC059352]|uniref:hypothetical protein n=1 Tax=Streptomyces sp. NPDC059352 TaxID=3346810 RepID=UPI0036808034
MARVRYIGPEPVTVPELGSRVVQPDETVEVPDDRFDGYVCQTTKWKAIEDPGSRAELRGEHGPEAVGLGLAAKKTTTKKEAS